MKSKFLLLLIQTTYKKLYVIARSEATRQSQTHRKLEIAAAKRRPRNDTFLLSFVLSSLCFLGTSFSPLSAGLSDGLLLNYDFEDDWTSNGILVDKSGNNRNADCQLNFQYLGITANQCPTRIQKPGGGWAGNFRGTTYNPALNSQYFALMNTSALKNMHGGSMAVWGKYDPDPNTGFLYGGAQLLESWNYSAGTWRLGKYWGAKTPYEGYTNFMVAPRRPTDAKDTYLITFPDANEISNWNHYAITWDGTTVRGYFNGQFIGMASQMGLDLTTNDNFLAIGANTHGAARNLPDPGNNTIMPNNGFLQGGLDDIRFYNRALSPSEIWQLFSGNPPANTINNGVLENGEECDDGNSTSGDGCNQGQVEPGYACAGSPSVCKNTVSQFYVSNTEPVGQAGQYTVQLSWQPNTTATDYTHVIERRAPYEVFQDVGQVRSDVGLFNDTVNASTNKYYYRIRTVKGSQVISYSTQIPVFAVESPSNLTAAFVESTHVALNWSNRANSSRQIIEFSDDGEVYVGVGDYITTGNYTDTYSFASNHMYYYRVCNYHDGPNNDASACSGASRIAIGSNTGATPTPTSNPTSTPTPTPAAATDTQFLPFKTVFNPTKETLAILYTVSGGKNEGVSLTVYDRMGNKIRALDGGTLSGSSFRTSWDGRNANGLTVASGSYVVVLKDGGKILKKKIVVVK